MNRSFWVVVPLKNALFRRDGLVKIECARFTFLRSEINFVSTGRRMGEIKAIDR